MRSGRKNSHLDLSSRLHPAVHDPQDRKRHSACRISATLHGRTVCPSAMRPSPGLCFKTGTSKQTTPDRTHPWRVGLTLRSPLERCDLQHVRGGWLYVEKQLRRSTHSIPPLDPPNATLPTRSLTNLVPSHAANPRCGGGGLY